jgi:hypothetical protein
VATDPPTDLLLDPINGEPRTVEEWLTMFRIAAVVVDPFTNESAWLLDTAARIMDNYEGADVRVAFLVTGSDAEARAFLGPLSERFLTFSDPDRVAVKALGLNELPALIHIRHDGKLVGVAEGWDPDEWRAIADDLAKKTSWSRPLIPAPGDPAPYAGTAAAG